MKTAIREVLIVGVVATVAIASLGLIGASDSMTVNITALIVVAVGIPMEAARRGIFPLPFKIPSWSRDNQAEVQSVLPIYFSNPSIELARDLVERVPDVDAVMWSHGAAQFHLVYKLHLAVQAYADREIRFLFADIDEIRNGIFELPEQANEARRIVAVRIWISPDDLRHWESAVDYASERTGANVETVEVRNHRGAFALAPN